MEWQALERAKMRAVAIEINWLLFLSVAPSHMSRDSERPMTSGEGAIKSDYWCVSLLHIYLFISLLLLLFFFVFLAVERNFWILEVDSFFFYWNEMFFNSKKIFIKKKKKFNNKVKFDWNSTSHWSGELELRAHPIRHHFVSNSILSIIISTVLPTLNSCDYSQIWSSQVRALSEFNFVVCQFLCIRAKNHFLRLVQIGVLGSYANN